MKKRILSMILVLLMIVSLFPSASFAEEPEVNDPISEPYDGTAAEEEIEEDPSTPPDGLAQDDAGDDPEALPPEGDEIQAIASGDCGDSLIWSLSDDGVLTIAGTGDMWDWASFASAPWNGHRDEIVTVRIVSGVTSIGTSAFMNCTNLTGITIPDGVTTIGGAAFFDCVSLIEMTIPSSVTKITPAMNAMGGIFCGCQNLTDVWFGGSIADWEKLRTIPDPYKTAIHCSDGDIAIVDPVYCGDDLIWTLNGDGVLTIAGTGDMWDFWEYASPWFERRSEIRSVRLLPDVTSVGKYAFGGCSSLTGVTLPASVTEIRMEAFDFCSNLTSVTLSEGLVTIGQSAFFYCSSLTSVTIPESVKTIEHAAFYNCSSLTSLTIPEGVTSIGQTAFRGCSSLPEILVAEGNNAYCAVDGVLYDKDKQTLWCFPGGKTGAFEIPGSVKRIAPEAFSDCLGITKVTIPVAMTEIGFHAFGGCKALTEIRFRGSAPAIGNYAFSNGVTATAYYLQADPSWTEEVRQNYGGTITWVAYGTIASGQCGDDLTWALDEDGILTISGTGDMWDYEYGKAPWYDHRNEITALYLPEGVTSIGDCAFSGCSGLMNVTIPECVTSIGDRAFSSCSGLMNVTIPEGVTSIGGDAFAICSSLTSVTIPAGVTSIGKGAFCGCSSLTSVTIPESVTEITAGSATYGLFESCESLKDIWFGGTVSAWKKLGAYADHYGATVHCSDGDYGPFDLNYCGDDLIWTLNGSGVLTIAGTGDMWDFSTGEAPWFDRRSEIQTVRLLSGVASVGNCAFSNCVSLTSVTIPEGVTRIGGAAFCCCRRLTSVTIPEGVTEIGLGAFFGCSSLTAATIPASVTKISYTVFMVTDGLFESCESLTDIWFGGTVSAWKKLRAYPDHYGATVHCSDGDYGPFDLNCCGDDLIWTLNGEGVLTVAGTGAMWDYSNIYCSPWNSRRNEIQTVRLLSGVTSIGNYAFCDRSSLTRVTIPAGVTSIGYNAFSGCSSLSSVEIPASVTSIGIVAFSGCSSLTEIRFQGAAPEIAGYTFGSVTATAYYPENDPTWTEEVRQNYGGTLTWVAYTPEIPIDEERFPDPIFRSYVAENFDSDGNGSLSEDEIAAATVIDLEGSGVASLEGIQLFPELTELNAGGDFETAGQLTSLDLSANTRLKSLNLGFNQDLGELDVSMLPELESLLVGFCGLSELDLSGNSALKELWCDDNNLTSLDLSANALLTHLDCCGNEGLTRLDIRPCPTLVEYYKAGGRHISWMQEGMPELYESIWVYGGTNDDDYEFAVNSWTEIIAEDPPTHVSGDINGDGSVNNKDVIRLQKYLKNSSTTVNEAALDVNGDGKVNNKDLIRLTRWLKYHDVEIH